MKSERWPRVREVLDEAIALPTDERAPYLDDACSGDAELRREVESLLGSYEGAGRTFLEAPPADLASAILDMGLPPSRIGRRIGVYQIVEEIGRGGMGEVYRAFRADGQYTKEVAIKIVRGGFDGSSLAERFRNERQILASLDHPNIARLLDGGSDDGVPYLVMELIEGTRIDACCDERRLPVTERLQLFRQICAAVQYAHQRLVIHRDLKPSNILVTREGTPKLLDFGIAKILDRAPGAHTTLVRMMTPEYASPEQVRGEPITTASDVYALGVVLYELLTGRSPYACDTGSALELSRAVCEAEPGRPSTAVFRRPSVREGTEGKRPTPEELSGPREGTPARLCRRLAGDLDAIVLKALRKEPQSRYASVDQLAEDIRRHLEGLPIAATKGSLRYRAGKFIRRHKLAMAASATVLLAVLAGAAATVRQARIARRQAEIAEAERLRAERRFGDVRKLANSVIFELHDAIQDLPGSTAARKLLVERALQYLDGLAEESRGDASLQGELADAYLRIGDVQGGPFGPNVGDTTLALTSYRKALSIYRAQLASGTHGINDSIRFAEASRRLGSALAVSGDMAGALDNSQRAVQTLEALLPRHPEHPRLLMELMRDYSAQADILASTLSLHTMGDASSALPLRQRQLRLAEELSRIQPGKPETQRSLGAARSVMGDQLLLTGQRREALEHYRQAQQIFDKMGTGSTTAGLLDVHDIYYRLSPAQLANGQIDESLASSQRALDLARKLSSSDPQNTQASLIMASDYANVADLSSRLGRRAEAYDALTRALSIDGELERKHPRTTEFRHVRCQRFQIAGDVCRRFGEYAQALRYYGRDAELLLEIRKADPANGAVHVLLASSYNGTGVVQTRLRQFSLAADAHRRALEALAPDLASESPSEEAVYASATAYAGLGDVEADLGDALPHDQVRRMAHWRQALSWYDASLGAWRKVREPGLVSPTGVDCIPLPVVAARRAKVVRELAGTRAAGP